MCRGIGSLQQRILDRLEQEGVNDRGMPSRTTSYELARSIGHAEPTRSERNSVQRAIGGLVAWGLVEAEHRPRRRDYRRIGGEELEVNLTPTEAQLAAAWKDLPGVLEKIGGPRR